MAILVCTCRHSLELHRYETRRGAWTVCRACPCVRFTAEDVEKRRN
jgi:hypothetical protein